MLLKYRQLERAKAIAKLADGTVTGVGGVGYCTRVGYTTLAACAAVLENFEEGFGKIAKEATFS